MTTLSGPAGHPQDGRADGADHLALRQKTGEGYSRCADALGTEYGVANASRQYPSSVFAVRPSELPPPMSATACALCGGAS